MAGLGKHPISLGMDEGAVKANLVQRLSVGSVSFTRAK